MPQRYSPYKLSDWAFMALIRPLVKACNRIENSDNAKESEEEIAVLKNYVSEIPYLFANDFVRMLIPLLTNCKLQKYLEILMHPKCSLIEIDGNVEKRFIPRILGHLGSAKQIETLKLTTCPEYRYVEDSDGEMGASDGVTTALLVRSMPNLSNLKVLHIPYVCNSELIQAISENCPLLVDLDISNHFICEGQLSSLEKCQKLQILNCTGQYESKIFVHRKFIFLVNRLPELRKLESVSVIHAAKFIHVAEKKFDAFKLEYACVEGGMSNNDVLTFCALFPNMREIVCGGRAIGSGVVLLRNFKNLESLTFSNENVLHLIELFSGISDKLKTLTLKSFGTGIDALFEKCKFPSLSSLSLESCADINLATVSESAPGLIKLLLKGCSPSPMEASRSTTPGFTQLQNLSIQGDFSFHHLRYMLGNCGDLTNLRLDVIGHFVNPQHSVRDLLNDRLFSELLNPDKLKCLKVLYLANSSVTLNVLKHLLENFDNLHAITLRSGLRCWNVPTDTEEARTIIRSVHNYRMTFELNSNDYYLSFDTNTALENHRGFFGKVDV